MTGAGGLLRDHRGRWLIGFSIRLDICSAVEAELWALIHGLRLSWDRGIKLLIVETDSLLLHSWLAKGEFGSHKYANWPSECIHLLHQGWTVDFKHVYRERNRAVDFLVSISKDLPT